MTEELHLVTDTQISVLLNWLETYLPESWLLYAVVREHVRYNWPGYTFYTLGWPEIRAACTGNLRNTSCECAQYFAATRKLIIFSLKEESIRTLLSWQGFVDWNKTIQFRVPEKMKGVIQEVIKDKGKTGPTDTFFVMMAHEGDIVEKPIPVGFHARALDADFHAPIMNNGWKYKSTYSEDYLKAMLRVMPSVGLFDRSERLLGHVMGSESGTISLLHVTPDKRRQGFGSVLASRLAHIYFKLGLPAVSYCHVDNEASVKLEEKLGFKKSARITFIYYKGVTIPDR